MNENELETESHEFFGTYLETRIIELHDPDFYENMIDECAHHLFDDCVCSGYIVCDAAALDTNEEYAAILFGEFRQTISTFAHIFYKMMGLQRRSYKHPKAHHYANVAKEDLDARLDWIRGAYQPAQRTPEWHLFRHGLISASNICKVFGTEASVNSLICEKCAPRDDVPNTCINTCINVQSPLHWGVKYEPVTAMIYQKRLSAELGEFGCIQHREHPFIGASPDGVVITREHSAYGRMLEIKNVVNREINGIPSMAYWIQMQVQMEVCNLEECDFVETAFKEYDYTEENLFYTNAANKTYEYNGVILYFINRDFVDSSPKYVYMPMMHNEKHLVDAWIDEQKQTIKDDYVLCKRIYWYCETFSCVLVHRNREWFAAALPKVREIWTTIELERTMGCEHRQPKKKKVAVSATETSKCLIDLSTME